MTQPSYPPNPPSPYEPAPVQPGPGAPGPDGLGPGDRRSGGHDGLPWVKTVLLGLLMVVVIGAGFGIWYIFFRPGGPAAVGTGAPVIPGAASPVATAAAPAAGSAGPVVPAASTVAVDLDGTWTVDPTIGSFDYAAGDFSGSWAGYRVQEQLVGLGGTSPSVARRTSPATSRWPARSSPPRT